MEKKLQKDNGETVNFVMLVIFFLEPNVLKNTKHFKVAYCFIKLVSRNYLLFISQERKFL